MWILFFLSGVQLLYNVVLALLCIKQITHVCICPLPLTLRSGTAPL